MLAALGRETDKHVKIGSEIFEYTFTQKCAHEKRHLLGRCLTKIRGLDMKAKVNWQTGCVKSIAYNLIKTADCHACNQLMLTLSGHRISKLGLLIS